MTLREALTSIATGMGLLTLALALPGCDRQSAPPSATSQVNSPSNAPSNPKSASGTSESSRSSSRTDSSPASTDAGTVAGDDTALPIVDLEGLSDRVKKKIIAAQDAVAAAPGSSRALCELGALYIGNGRTDAALACFRRAAELVPSAFTPRYFIALTQAHAGRDEEAIREFGAAIELDPDYMPARIRQADLQFKLDKSKAAEMYRAASDILPDAPFPHFRLAECLLELGRPDDAEKSLLKAVELQPDFGDAHAAIAELYKAANKPDAAAEHERLARSGKPVRPFADPLYTGLIQVGRSGEFAASRAMSLAFSGKVDEALAFLSNASASDPENMLYVATQATIQESIGRFAEAARLWEQVRAIDPTWPGAAARLANAYANTNQLPKAISSLKAYLRDTPDDADARQTLALMLARNREFDAAADEARAVVESREKSAGVLCQYALVLIECGRLSDAAARLDEAESLDSKLPDVHLLRGMMFARSGEVPRAFEAYDRAMERNPGNVLAYSTAAELARENRDWARQSRILRSGLEQNPNAHSMSAALAHLLATCPDEAIRNGADAVKLANQACAATAMSNHAYMDILGEAHAEAGEFEQAIAAARKAIALAKQDRASEMMIRYQVKLDLYEARKPFHAK